MKAGTVPCMCMPTKAHTIRYKDKADTLEHAKEWNQLRFSDIIAVSDTASDAEVPFKKGQLLYRFGHEIRSLDHRRCPKILLAGR